MKDKKPILFARIIACPVCGMRFVIYSIKLQAPEKLEEDIRHMEDNLEIECPNHEEFTRKFTYLH